MFDEVFICMYSSIIKKGSKTFLKMLLNVFVGVLCFLLFFFLALLFFVFLNFFIRSVADYLRYCRLSWGYCSSRTKWRWTRCSWADTSPAWPVCVCRRWICGASVCAVGSCAWAFCAVTAPLRLSFSGRHSWRTGPSSLCTVSSWFYYFFVEVEVRY